LEDGNCRKKDDIDQVSNIFQKNLGVVSGKVTIAVRLGKRSDKPRLLKVSVDSVISKASICGIVLS